MIDPKFLRQDPKQVATDAARHNVELDIDTFIELDTQRKSIQEKTERLQSARNQLAKKIGQAKSKGEDTTALMKESTEVNEALKLTDTDLSDILAKLEDFQLRIPNRLHESVPEGRSEADNVVIKTWGAPKSFSFKPKDHVDLGLRDNFIDFESASALSGARFVVLQDKMAQLQRALGQFMLELHTQQHGYKEVYVPYLVHAKALYGTGQLPKFSDDFFSIAGDNDFVLIPTAEVSMVNLVREQILDEKTLPIKFVTQSPCFRSEAGSYGKDTRGMIRQHQFQKVELVQVVKPEESYDRLEEMTQHAEKILQLLELPYRIMALCSADVGFAASKTYDIEVWLPSQNMYREISSCSNCEDFQARRMQARYKSPQMKKPELVHTLNGSGVAVGRALVAVIENYQDEEGRIHVPKVLQPYMNGVEVF